MILDQRSVIAIAAALLGAALVVACGSSSSPQSPAASGGSAGVAGRSGGSGGTNAVGGSTGTAGSAGAGAAGAAGADEGGTPIVGTSQPHAAAALVAGGTIAHGKNFTGVFVLGEAPGGNGISTGKSRQLRGGVVGASQ